MVAKCDQVSGLLSKVKTLLPLWLTLREYNVTVGQNARDQITQTSGGSRVGAGGTRPPSPLIFRPNWGPKGQKNFLETGPPPYLRFWMTTPNYLKVWIRQCKRESDCVHCKWGSKRTLASCGLLVARNKILLNGLLDLCQNNVLRRYS